MVYGAFVIFCSLSASVLIHFYYTEKQSKDIPQKRIFRVAEKKGTTQKWGEGE